LGVGDLAGTANFVLAFAVVHEMPHADAFFAEAAQALKPDGLLLLVEPSGHVGEGEFTAKLQAAASAGFGVASAGFGVINRPSIRRSAVALLKHRTVPGA
jgi:SAM-dependent methyltransferase